MPQTTPKPPFAAADSEVVEWVRHMAGKDGKDFLSVGTTENGYLARYAHVADYHIDTDQESVRWTVTNRAFRQAQQSAVHLGKNQVLPMLLARREVLVLHASACILPNGNVIAFSGPSGIGKSTLAEAATQLPSVRQFADDWIVIASSQSNTQAFAYSEDVAKAIATQVPIKSTKKPKRVAPTHEFALSGLESFRTTSLPLQAIYMLEKPSTTEAIQITPIKAKARFVRLVQNLFRLDSRHRHQLQKELRLLTRLLDTTPIYSLSYPRIKQQRNRLAKHVTEHNTTVS